jgi:hypothetical protein
MLPKQDPIKDLCHLDDKRPVKNDKTLPIYRLFLTYLWS